MAPSWGVMCELVLVLLMGCQGSTENLYGKFILLGDLHYDPTYETTGESCNTDFPAAQRGKYGDLECDAPWALIETTFNKVLAESSQADFVVWTGDSLPHVRVKEWRTEEDVVNVLGNITDYITKIITKPVLPALGNHDYWPGNQLPGTDGDPLYRKIAEIWKPFLEPIGAMESFMRGGFYSTLFGDKFRVVILNTNLYYTSNLVTANDIDPGGQFVWFRKLLLNASANGERVHVFMHIPPGPVEYAISLRVFRPKFNKRFNDIILEFSDIIIGVYGAHAHTDSFRIFYKNQKPVVPLLINPSITPWRYPGPSTDSWPHNPALRVLFYTTGENPYLSNYTQYYLDLKDVNKKTEPASFRTEYTFTAAYDVNDVTATSLHAVVAKFKTSQSDTLFQGYFTRNLVSFDTSGRRRCMNCTCRGFHICVLENVYYDRVDACVADVRATCGVQGLPVPGIALLLLVAIIGLPMLRSTCSYM